VFIAMSKEDRLSMLTLNLPLKKNNGKRQSGNIEMSPNSGIGSLRNRIRDFSMDFSTWSRKVPLPVIAFEDLRNKNTIACYNPFPDECSFAF
jgi:hypothetical protein